MAHEGSLRANTCALSVLTSSREPSPHRPPGHPGSALDVQLDRDQAADVAAAVTVSVRLTTLTVAPGKRMVMSAVPTPWSSKTTPLSSPVWAG